MGNGTAKGALEYLQNLEAKGKASSGAIAPLKIAVSKVLQVVDGDDWENTDIRKVDIEDYMSRFANLTMGKYASESLTAYKSRLTRALSWYLQFLEKPGWTPDVNRRAVGVKSSKKNTPIRKAKPAEHTATSAQVPALPDQSSDAGFGKIAGRIIYPYPLSDGQLIHISLPVRLSRTDAKRIGTFIESIAIDEEGSPHA
ncbi:MAG: hypothetical protein ACREGE_01040 [Candidatus Microsaccharimonas sp.]